MARHVFVLLLVAICSLQVALSLPRGRRDAEEATEAGTNILESLNRLASDIPKKTQEFFSADTLRAIEADVNKLAQKIDSAFSSAIEGSTSPAPPV